MKLIAAHLMKQASLKREFMRALLGRAKEKIHAVTAPAPTTMEPATPPAMEMSQAPVVVGGNAIVPGMAPVVTSPSSLEDEGAAALGFPR